MKTLNERTIYKSEAKNDFARFLLAEKVMNDHVKFFPERSLRLWIEMDNGGKYGIEFDPNY